MVRKCSAMFTRITLVEVLYLIGIKLTESVICLLVQVPVNENKNYTRVNESWLTFSNGLCTSVGNGNKKKVSDG
jgi:hypothetical protein